MSGDQAEVEKKEPLFWPLNLLPGLTHMFTIEQTAVNNKPKLFNAKIFILGIKNISCNGTSLCEVPWQQIFYAMCGKV